MIATILDLNGTLTWNDNVNILYFSSDESPSAFINTGSGDVFISHVDIKWQRENDEHNTRLTIAQTLRKGAALSVALKNEMPEFRYSTEKFDYFVANHTGDIASVISQIMDPMRKVALACFRYFTHIIIMI